MAIRVIFFCDKGMLGGHKGVLGGHKGVLGGHNRVYLMDIRESLWPYGSVWWP